MYPHSIRLRGPWQCKPLARTRFLPDGSIASSPIEAAAVRASVPGIPEDQTFRGTLAFSRVFHHPRRLDERESLWICCDGVDYFADLTVNGQAVGMRHDGLQPFAFDISSVVAERNELVIAVDCPTVESGQPMSRGPLNRCAGMGGLWGGVRLEVRSRAFFDTLSCWANVASGKPMIQVTGEVVRCCEGPLTIDVAVDGVSLANHPIPAGDRVPIELVVPFDRAARWFPRSVGQPHVHEYQLSLIGDASALDSRNGLLTFRDVVVNDKTATVNGVLRPCRFVDLEAPTIHDYLAPVSPARPGRLIELSLKFQESIPIIPAAAGLHPSIVTAAARLGILVR